ncbi:tRNA threonylcarbamoyladenosine biosynthesis protein TsaE [Candidatus Kinetoplastibacterium sorsogonicusi]|uniref:tRNA threonylcarbamoyladenosine biosynthesis protein TsaE n=1 Tax=Candidatus Kinetoplastidibacterium kentomonadis TaxID=1576550 RepID=A0A3S7JAH3_9PROT|nr:tRNA (adenosine(37)-N6)-threonylcarbamoyltransferase complex ATPase subunit type 1 TsaE [Candidatus Kinetoplastibacterium sorsogonicusi]AWD32641.1 tRNA threonylcarbamoyladenosine biosynthesis protein TsaE [Candidatus Kinetoplastibacterium sorsogonicusi]
MINIANINNLQDTIIIAQKISKFILKNGHANNINIHLNGPVGIGKTTLIRYILQNCGIKARIKSPSFNIIEYYSTESFKFYHIDFYRLNNRDTSILFELKDYIKNNSILLIEWPEIFLDDLPKPNISIVLEYINKNRVAKIFAKDHIKI